MSVCECLRRALKRDRRIRSRSSSTMYRGYRNPPTCCASNTVTIEHHRSFDLDLRSSLVALYKIASRTLARVTNDPCTGIVVLNALPRVFLTLGLQPTIVDTDDTGRHRVYFAPLDQGYADRRSRTYRSRRQQRRSRCLCVFPKRFWRCKRTRLWRARRPNAALCATQRGEGRSDGRSRRPCRQRRQ